MGHYEWVRLCPIRNVYNLTGFLYFKVKPFYGIIQSFHLSNQNR